MEIAGTRRKKWFVDQGANSKKCTCMLRNGNYVYSGTSIIQTPLATDVWSSVRIIEIVWMI